MKATDKVTITIEAGALKTLYDVMSSGDYDTWRELKGAMYPVMISDSNGHYCNYKFDDETKSVKLNDEYSAEILDGIVKVGCQEFSFDAIKKLNKAIKKS